MTAGAARSRARSAGALALLAAALPFNLTLTGAALAFGGRRRCGTGSAGRRTVLITGGKMTKALALARAFAADGHRVVLAESAPYRWTGHRFSRAVSAFHLIPRPDSAAYVDAIVALVEREGVDLFVPVCSPASSIPDGAVADRLRGRCESVHPGQAAVESVDDKAAFAELASSLGLSVPQSHRITSAEQVANFDFAAHPGQYVLKRIAYDPVRRLDVTTVPRETPQATRAHVEALPIADDDPWVMQAFVAGEEWCTHTVLREGRVVVHCTCRSSAVQLNYEAVPMPAIDRWVQRFADGFPHSGQLAFDFIIGEDGIPLAIECNPRTHSAVTAYHDHSGLAAAYLGEVDAPIAPLPGSRPTLWLYEELWRLITGPGRWRTLGRIARGQDAIFAWSDPLPFLLVHHLQIPLLLARALARGTAWHHIDFNIGKLAEPGGD